MNMTMTSQTFADQFQYASISSFDSLALFEQYEPVEVPEVAMHALTEDACDNLYLVPS